jgi:hypothetical protein
VAGESVHRKGRIGERVAKLDANLCSLRHPDQWSRDLRRLADFGEGQRGHAGSTIRLRLQQPFADLQRERENPPLHSAGGASVVVRRNGGRRWRRKVGWQQGEQRECDREMPAHERWSFL